MKGKLDSDNDALVRTIMFIHQTSASTSGLIDLSWCKSVKGINKGRHLMLL